MNPRIEKFDFETKNNLIDNFTQEGDWSNNLSDSPNQNKNLQITRNLDLKCISTQTEAYFDPINNEKEFDSNMDFEKEDIFGREVQSSMDFPFNCNTKSQSSLKNAETLLKIKAASLKNLQNIETPHYYNSEPINSNTAETSKDLSFEKNSPGKKIFNQADKDLINIVYDFNLKKNDDWSKSTNNITSKTNLMKYKNCLEEQKVSLRPNSKYTYINKQKKEAKQLFIGIDDFDYNNFPNYTQGSNKNFFNSRTTTAKSSKGYKNIFLKNKTVFKNTGKLNNFIAENLLKNKKNNNQKINYNDYNLEIEFINLKPNKENRIAMSAFRKDMSKNKEFFNIRTTKEKNAIVYDTGMFTIPLMHTVEK